LIYTFGPAIGDHETRFRLWAPSIDGIALEIEGSAPLPLVRDAGGWQSVTAPVGPGARYRFRLPSGEAVPDPASRAQPEDVHGPSLVVDPNSHAWRCADWRGRPWEKTVLYELHAGLLGGFRGVAAALPALAELGITAVELMPIAEFTGARNWGYDGVLPYAPESAYGTPDDLKAMVDRAHELGLMVFLDVVYNHFGPDGNWLPLYAPEFFRQDEPTPWGAAIDYRRPEVRRYFTENALYWLEEFRFDGLRFDAVHAISEPGWIDEMAAEVRAAFPDRHVHLILENERNEASHLRREIDAQWNDDFHNVMHVLLTGETHAYYESFAERPAERLARSLQQGFIYQGEPSPHHKGKPRGTPSADLRPTAFVNFLQNHDQTGNRALGERLTVLVERPALRAAATLLLLCPAIPLIFMGEETGSTRPFLFFTDFHDELADAVREGRRKEFAGFPAFADPASREKIPDPNALATFEASLVAAADPVPDPDAGEWRTLYRDLLALRRQSIVPRLVGAKAIDARPLADKAVLARWRMGDGAVLTIVSNFGDLPVEIDVPAQDLLWGEPDGSVIAAASTIAWLGSDDR
jgi:malto-oligosyltrehalose trehalohydrolase